MPQQAISLRIFTRVRSCKIKTLRCFVETPKGFHRSDFEQAWSRYLPPPYETAATSATTATHDITDVAAVADVAAPW
jgi:dTDP-4-amino-4,6-dideoxygalactose transaminase